MSRGPWELPFEVMIVDDEAFVRETLALYLESEGCVVHTAENGFEAIERIAEHPIEAAVIDIRMPGMDGLTLLSELKARAPDLEVLMSTGFQSLETAVEAMRRGACDYITKPITDLENDLYRFIVRAIERRRLRLCNRELSHGLQCAIDELGGVRGDWTRHLRTLAGLEDFGRRTLQARSIDDLLIAAEEVLPRITDFRAAAVRVDTDELSRELALGEEGVLPTEPPALADEETRWSETPNDDDTQTVWFRLDAGPGPVGRIGIRPAPGRAVRDTERLVLRAFCDQLALAISARRGLLRREADRTA